MSNTDMTFDPATCGWDRPHEGAYADGSVRIYRKDGRGVFLWARQATPEEVLWIAQYEQHERLVHELQLLNRTLREFAAIEEVRGRRATG
jgi:hypothetical protein